MSMVLRLAGDFGLGRWRAWGGLLNAVALTLFVLNVIRSVLLERRAGYVKL